MTDAERLTELAQLVEITRTAQREFFATRHCAARVKALEKARKLERQLDDLLATILRPLPCRRSLDQFVNSVQEATRFRVAIVGDHAWADHSGWCDGVTAGSRGLRYRVALDNGRHCFAEERHLHRLDQHPE